LRTSFFRKFTTSRIGRTGGTPATTLISFFVFFIVTAPEQTGGNNDDKDYCNVFHLLSPQKNSLAKALSLFEICFAKSFAVRRAPNALNRKPSTPQNQ
jgi:hypothetical protein